MPHRPPPSTSDTEAAVTRDGRVVLTGPWGAGKSTLLRTLAGRSATPTVGIAPASADRSLPWSALTELLAALAPATTAALPAPHRATLTALLHHGRADSPLAVRLALAAALAPSAAADTPRLLLVDNAQWVDGASAAALGYVLRTIPEQHLRAVIAVRGQRLEGDAQLLVGPTATHRSVPPLELDDVLDVLADHDLPTRWAAEILRGSGGNAALVHAAVGRTTAGAAADWLGLLAPAARDTLLLAALARRPRPALLLRAGATQAETHLAQARAAGILRPLDDQHGAGGGPAFAAGWLRDELTASADAVRRTAAHTALAAAEPDPVHATLHRTLAASGFDAATAARAEEAAVAARHTGQPDLAAELLLLAAERTPTDQPTARRTRLDQAVTAATASGSSDLARQVADAVAEARSGPAHQVAALLALVDVGGQAMHEMDDALARAASLADGDAALAAAVQLRVAIKANICDGDPHRARAAADTAARLAHSGRHRTTEVLALTMRARTERLLGRTDASEATLTQALALRIPLTDTGVRGSPQYLAVRHAVFDDRLADAHAELLRILPVAEQLGDAEDLEEVLRSLAAVDARSGRCARAREWSRRALALCAATNLSPGPAWYTASLAESAGGTFRQAAAHATHGLRASEEERDMVFTSRNLLALGSAHLAAGNPREAVAVLGRVAELEGRQHVTDPRALPWQPELAEALAATRDLAGARSQLQRLAPTVSAHPDSSLAAATLRARASCLAGHGEPEEARAHLADAAERFAALALPLEQGRTLLATGRLERSQRRVGTARATWREALALFDAAGAAPWSALTGDLLGRLDGPRPESESPLTDTESRLAALVAEGASNQDAAARLFVSVKTVETTLSRIYRKLNIRTRTQLASALARRGAPRTTDGEG